MNQRKTETGDSVSKKMESVGFFILNIAKGAVVAVGAVLPGISGGALCVILGIYRRIMALLCHPFQEIKKQWKLFVCLALGFAAGTLFASRVIGSFLEKAETEALFLFIGLIAGTLPALFKEARSQGFTRESWLAFFIAAAIMLVWMIPMSLSGSTAVVPSFGWWCICGVLWGLGIVIPGMSPSNIFLFLGLAGPMYSAIGSFDVSVILPMGICVVLTIFALSKGVDYCLRKWYSVFMHAVIGIVAASTVVIFPPFKLLIVSDYSFETSFGDWFLYTLCFSAGLVCAGVLSRIQKTE